MNNKNWKQFGQARKKTFLAAFILFHLVVLACDKLNVSKKLINSSHLFCSELKKSVIYNFFLFMLLLRHFSLFLCLSFSRGAGVFDSHRTLHHPRDSPLLVPQQQVGPREPGEPSVPWWLQEKLRAARWACGSTAQDLLCSWWDFMMILYSVRSNVFGSCQNK